MFYRNNWLCIIELKFGLQIKNSRKLIMRLIEKVSHDVSFKIMEKYNAINDDTYIESRSNILA